ncbi:hypothetical protein MGN70_013864 [Eutypa lata]|nr:hypothetical protein MGN70_013864 [Eutypa lata]
MPNSGQSSLWSTAGAGSRNMGGAIQRNQPTPHSQQGHDDLFSSASRMSTNQGSFRFGNQTAQSSQPPPSSIDDFPPLNISNFRNGNGEIGQERGMSLMSTLGFGAQGGGAAAAAGATAVGASAGTSSLQGTRVGNGLLNALSANTRSSEVRSPDTSAAPGALRTHELRSASGVEETRQKPPGFRDEALTSSQASAQDQAAAAAAAQLTDGRNPLGAIGSNDTPSSGGKAGGGGGVVGSGGDEKDGESPVVVHDPLAGMAPIDRWGIKGLRTLMNNYPDYTALMTGMDPTGFGLDLTSPAPVSTQVYSLFNDVPPRPAVPEFRLPECYSVNNVQPLENKISSFNEETLMWIFYSCPGDFQQHKAATELNNRNWRWHKKLKMWLTKDEHMHPRPLSREHEEGYYIIWNTAEWRKERRSLTLYYSDLEHHAAGNP